MRREPPGESAQQAEPRWCVVDRALREIAARRAALDAEEAQWLREAEALKIWRQLGMVSALDYLERVLHYSPRTAQDRLRVARALGSLPELTAALADGRLSHSAVRELTRVVTPATEAAWLAAAVGKNLRQIEELVAHHRPGDGPDDPPDPEAQTHVVRFELAAETYALLRQTRVVLDDEHGTNLSEDAFVMALCSAVLDDAPTAEPTGRAKFQIAMVVCERCRKGWQEGAGAKIAIDDAAVERGLCDAQHIGSIDGAAPERAYQDIAPSVARFVWRRDGGRCRVEGCRSARGIELHHIVHRADGGTHEPSNLSLLCSSCHAAHHRGTLSITGTADRLVIQRPGQSASTEGSARSPIQRTAEGVHPPIERVAVAIAQSTPAAPVANGSAHVGAPALAAATSPTPSSSIIVAHANAHVGARGPTATSPTPPSSIIGAHANAHVGAPASAAIIARDPASAVEDRNAHVGARGPTTTSPTPPSSITGVHANAHVGVSRLNAAILRTQAKDALIGLGWKAPIAGPAVAAAAAALGGEVTLERLLVESLRRCPVPKVS